MTNSTTNRTTLESFSLLDNPWIKCENLDGETVEFSLRDIFDRENYVKAVRGDSPAQDYAVLRVLLAIYWRAHHPETKVKGRQTFDSGIWFENALEQSRSGSPDSAVLEYLEKLRDRFDLLHPVTPFMQVADLHTLSGSTSDVERIVPEAEQNYFTMRSGAGREILEFPEAARWLIYAQAYDYSGIKSGAVGDSRVKNGKGFPIGTGWTGMTGGTVLEGATLRETLVLNTTGDALVKEHDLPVWERDPDTAAERSDPHPSGAADLATWQSRRIRLHVEDGVVSAVLVSNGDRIPDAGANILLDPMTPYRFSKNKSKGNRTVYYPRPYDVERTMWRSLEPLVTLEGDPGFDDKNAAPKRPEILNQLAFLAGESEEEINIANLRLVSVEYGPQASSVATTVSAQIEIPVALLRENARQARRAVLDVANASSNAGIALGSFAGMLLVAAGGDYAFQPAPTDTLLARLEVEFITWLSGLDTADLTRHSTQWQRFVRKEVLDEAGVLLRGAGPRALIGREVSQPGSDETRLTSAGTAYRWLVRRLSNVLPLSTPEDTPTQETQDAR